MNDQGREKVPENQAAPGGGAWVPPGMHVSTAPPQWTLRWRGLTFFLCGIGIASSRRSTGRPSKCDSWFLRVLLIELMGRGLRKWASDMEVSQQYPICALASRRKSRAEV